MRENTFEVDWAEELGIQMSRLWMEHPGHPFQLKNKKRIIRQGEDYWKLKNAEAALAELDAHWARVDAGLLHGEQ